MIKQLSITILAVSVLSLISFGCDFLGSDEGSSPKKAQSKLHVPDPKNIVTDEDTGLNVEQDVILITFSRFVDEAKAKEVVKEVGGEIVGFDLDSNFFQVKLAGADLKKSQEVCLQLLQKHKDVELAALNTVSKADNPYWESSN